MKWQPGSWPRISDWDNWAGQRKQSVDKMAFGQNSQSQWFSFLLSSSLVFALNKKCIGKHKERIVERERGEREKEIENRKVK